MYVINRNPSTKAHQVCNPKDYWDFCPLPCIDISDLANRNKIDKILLYHFDTKRTVFGSAEVMNGDKVVEAHFSILEQRNWLTPVYIGNGNRYKLITNDVKCLKIP